MMSKMSMFPQALHDFVKFNGPSKDHVFNTSGPSLTRQEFAEECDINTLMSRYDTHVIGGPGNMSPVQPFYADFSDLPGNLMEYMSFMAMAEEQFMRLPAVVRRTFENSPHEFVAFASDPGNLEQMRAWGLAPPAPPVELSPAGAPASPPAVGSAPPGAPGGASTHVRT